MLCKPVCVALSNNFAKLFSGTTVNGFITLKHGKWYNVPKRTEIRPIGECIKRFAETEAQESRPRLIRQEPSPVRLGFIPEEWFTFFFSKTGVTGLGTFSFTFSIFLMSKEYYVMEHEYYGGLSMLILCVAATKYGGPAMAKFLDKEIDEYEDSWNSVRNNQKKELERGIKHEEKLQYSADGQLILTEAKRENVALQLEGAYRERLMHAYHQTKKRLEYCVSREQVEQAILRRHMANWVVKQVHSSINEKLQTEALNKCMEDLAKLAKTFEGLAGPYPTEPDETPPAAGGGTPPTAGGTPPTAGGTPPTAGGTPPTAGGTPPAAP